MKNEEKEFILEAANFFENPSSFTKSLHKVGSALETGLTKLPAPLQVQLHKAVRTAVEGCLTMALKTISSDKNEASPSAPSGELNLKARSSEKLHSVVAGITGGVSGFLGPEALLVELPLTTTLMLRSISATAKDLGFDLSDPAIQLECLMIFSLGGPKATDLHAKSGYFTARSAFHSLFQEVLGFVAGRSAGETIGLLREGSAPVLVKLVSEIAEVFGIRVSSKVAAQLAPVVGAIGGAGINYYFTDFFNRAARYHFGIRRLELLYGAAEVQAIYQKDSADT